MRKSFYTGNTVLNFFTNKHNPINLYYNSKYLSVRANQIPKRLKTESEQKFIHNSILPRILNKREIKTRQDWKMIRNELFQAGNQITLVNIDSAILSFCIRQENYNLAYSYMKFLKEENLKPNLATIGKYFRLFYLSNCDKVLDESEELNVLALYQELRKTYKVLDAITCESAIHALSLTNNWKECLKLLEEIKIGSEPSAAVCSIIASVAFKNNENDLAWKLLNEIAEKNRAPFPVAFLSYLQQCENSSTPDMCLKKIEKLFEFFKCNDLKCNIEVVTKLTSIYTGLQRKCTTTIINNRGICTNCKQKLQKFELTENEFQSLKDAVFKNVIVGKNVFCRTTPDELKRFEEFITNMPKYDVVIDGLNVAYSAGVKQPPHILSGMLAAVVKHFEGEGKKILVLGRTHMQKWSGKSWFYVTQHADMFLTQTLSQDDPYLLYCALHCGLNTIIVSRDLMRSHLFRLHDTQLKILFNQWLTQSQYQLQYVNNQGIVFFKYPLPYVKTAQKQENCWHVPYTESDDAAVDNKWLCLSA